MGRFLITAVLLGLFIGHVAAQQQDSARTSHSDTVTVTAVRPLNLVALQNADAVVKPTASFVAATGSRLASEAFQAITSSLAIRRYGSLGGVGFLSYRGLPAEYTVVYRDGIRVTSEQNSLTDVGQLELAGIDNIELLPASSSIVLGGDAIGTAINLVTNPYDTVHARAGSTVTNYATAEIAPEITSFGSVATELGPVRVTGNVTAAHTTGRYPFRTTDWPSEVLRENSDATVVQESGSATYEPAPSDRLHVLVNHFSADRGVTGGSTRGRGTYLYEARQTDDQLFTLTNWEHADSLWTAQFAGTYQVQRETYSNPPYHVHDASSDEVVGGNARFSWSTSFANLYAGTDILRSRLAGTTDQLPSGDSIITRARYSTYIATQKGLSRLTLSAALRAERVSDFGDWQYLPQLAASYAITDEISVDAGYGRSFHAPTLNALYWSSEGGVPNPNLRPERADSYVLSTVGKRTFGALDARASLTLFHTTVDDEIVWQLYTQNAFIARNVGRVQSRGGELHLNAALNVGSMRISVEETYTLLDARILDTTDANHEAPFSTPTASLFQLRLEENTYGTLNLLSRYMGHRFTDPANGEMLPPQTVYDAVYTAPSFNIGRIAMITRLAVLDLTNEQIVEIPNYPLPARHYTFSLEFAY